MQNPIKTYRLVVVPFMMLIILASWGFYAMLAHAGMPGSQAVIQGVSADGPTATPTPAPCDPIPAIVNSPNGSGSQNRLRAVTAIAPNDIWAVGFYQSSGFFQTMTIHWDGTQWTLVPSPNGPSDDNVLYGVTAFASNDVWAVGWSSDQPVSASTTLVLRWNGTSWNTVGAPSPGQRNELYGISGVSSNDIWAVGIRHNGTADSERTLAMRWNGSQWTENSPPNYGTGANFVYDVEAIASNNVRAVGHAHEPTFNGFRTRIWRWDGSSWTAENTPNLVTQGDNALLGISASSANDIWAVGYSGDSTYDSTVMRYDGTAWNPVAFPFDPPSGNSLLRSVYAISPTDVWVIGDYDVDHLTARWDGSVWRRIFDPVYDELFDITAASPSVVWSVGHDARFTLTIRYTYPCPPGTPSATPTGLASATPTRTNTATPVTTSSATATRTPTWTQTATPVATSSGTAFATQTNTAVATDTAVATAMQTGTSTATASPTHCAIVFQDVPEGSTFYEFVRCMACQGIVTGYPCGGPGEPCGTTGDPYFRPNSNVTRGQITKIVANSAGFIEPVTGQTFEDVPAGHTFYEFVQRLTDREIMTGYPCGNPEPCMPPDNRPYFRPGANASRGQLAKIVSNAANIQDPVSGQTFEDVVPGSTFYEFIERLVARGVMSGYQCGAPEPCVPPDNRPYFRPASNVTRGQTSKIVANTFFPGCEPPR